MFGKEAKEKFFDKTETPLQPDVQGSQLSATILPHPSRKKLLHNPPFASLAEKKFHSHVLTFTSVWRADWGLSNCRIWNREVHCFPFFPAPTHTEVHTWQQKATKHFSSIPTSIIVRVRTTREAMDRSSTSCHCWGLLGIRPRVVVTHSMWAPGIRLSCWVLTQEAAHKKKIHSLPRRSGKWPNCTLQYRDCND